MTILEAIAQARASVRAKSPYGLRQERSRRERIARALQLLGLERADAERCAARGGEEGVVVREVLAERGRLAAEPFVAELNANTDAFYGTRISWDEHRARNRAVWDRICAAGSAVHAAVDAALLSRLP
jgi:hypothetical protein